MILLRLAAGGRIGIRTDDAVWANPSAWGSIVRLADGTTFEVEHTVEELSKLVPALWFRAGDIALNPDRIVTIWEQGATLHYTLETGLKMTQYDVDLHEFVDIIRKAREDRRKMGLG